MIEVKKIAVHIHKKQCIVSINVFKNHPGDEVTFSDRSVLYSELKLRGPSRRFLYFNKNIKNTE